MSSIKPCLPPSSLHFACLPPSSLHFTCLPPPCVQRKAKLRGECVSRCVKLLGLWLSPPAPKLQQQSRFQYGHPRRPPPFPPKSAKKQKTSTPPPPPNVQFNHNRYPIFVASFPNFSAQGKSKSNFHDFPSNFQSI